MKIWSFVLINNKFFNNVKYHTKYLLMYNDLLCPFCATISLFKPHELNSLNIDCIRIDCSSSRCNKIKITPTSNYMVCNKLVYSLYRIYIFIFFTHIYNLHLSFAILSQILKKNPTENSPSFVVLLRKLYRSFVQRQQYFCELKYVA